MGQLSFYSADAHPRAVTDLEGVLCAQGQVLRFGRGSTARLGITLGTAATPEADPEHADDPEHPDDPEPDPLVAWRAHALRCAFHTRGVDAEVRPEPDGTVGVRSAFRADLVALARRWGGGTKAVPADLELDGPRLRLWVLAAGRRDRRAYVLGLDPLAPSTHEPLRAAAARAGLDTTLDPTTDPAADAPVLRLTGVRRLRRLAELVGDPPRHLIDEVWPG